jgi:hypothetical protein
MPKLLNRRFWENILKQENLLLDKNYSSWGAERMDADKMLEIIETGAWIPKKKAEKRTGQII